MSAARRGEAFDVSTGRPVSMRRAEQDMPWYRFACSFVVMKWSRVAATTRRTHAEALTAVTVLLLAGERGRPDDGAIRSALVRWGFNTARRVDCPPPVRPVLRWVERHS